MLKQYLHSMTSNSVQLINRRSYAFINSCSDDSVNQTAVCFSTRTTATPANNQNNSYSCEQPEQQLLLRTTWTNSGQTRIIQRMDRIATQVKSLTVLKVTKAICRTWSKSARNRPTSVRVMWYASTSWQNIIIQQTRSRLLLICS
jgi:hypothetical protein